MEYAAIAAAITSFITMLVGAGKDAEAQALRQKMLDQYGPELLPHLERAEAQQMGPSALASMPEDDTLRRSQMNALSELENIYASEGMTDADKAALELANNTVAARANADAAQASQAMAQRGVRNSGLGYALNIQGQQNAANTLGNMARQSQVDARSRALRALEAGAGLAGNIRGDDFRRASELSGAQDRIAMFNATQRADAQRYNLGLSQQDFDNKMLLANARTGVAGGVAAGYERAGQSARETGAGAANAMLTYGMWGDKKGKK